jgi:hypothetical protein
MTAKSVALITDSSQVRCLDGGTEVWRGDLATLERENCFDDQECAELRSALFETGRYGGGHALIVELVGRYAVTVIDGEGSSVRYFPTIGVAIAQANRIFRKSEGTSIVVVNDLEAGEAISSQFMPILDRDLLAISSLLNPSQRVA